jgi:hypothetical protein
MGKQRFEYSFVKLKAKGISARSHDYHGEVHRLALDGWRLITVLTPPGETDGTNGCCELVFERPVEDQESRFCSDATDAHASARRPAMSLHTATN